MSHGPNWNGCSDSREMGGTEGIFVDIGANLLDPMYSGIYRDKPRHDPDLSSVLDRAWNNNLDRIIVTGGTLEESKKGWELAKTDKRLFCTVGVHPTRCSSEFGETEESWARYLDEMKKLVKEGMDEGSVVAMGELGLDYARLQFCDTKTQKKGFVVQLQVCIRCQSSRLFFCRIVKMFSLFL